MSIFLTPEKHPFFAGTYFPKTTQRGMIGFSQLLTLIWEKWEEDKKSLEDLAQEITDSFHARNIPMWKILTHLI